MRTRKNLFSDKLKFELIKHSKRRERSKYFGIGSIIYSLLTFLSVFLLYFSIKKLSGKLEGGDVLIYVILILTAIAIGFPSFAKSILHMIYQFRMNALSIRWSALAIFAISLIASVIFLVRL